MCISNNIMNIIVFIVSCFSGRNIYSMPSRSKNFHNRFSHCARSAKYKYFHLFHPFPRQRNRL